MTEIAALSKNNGTALEELLKLPVLDAEGKIPAAVLRIVGALSAGAVIESGDNANGYYVRFADGTQVCYGHIVLRMSGTYCTYTITMPAEFIDYTNTGAIFPLSSPGVVVYAGACSIDTTSLRWTFYGINGSGNMQSMNVTFMWLVIGRWKK